MRSSPISVEERFRNQFKQIHSSTYDKRLFGRERMPAQKRDEDDDVPTATTSASFEFSADLSRRMNNNNDRILSNFLRAGSSHSNDRTMRPADDEEDDGTTCTTRDTSLESAAALSDAFKCTKRSASVPNSSSDGEATSERERSLSLPSKLTGPPFGDSMMSGDSGFVQEHGQKDSRQSTPPNPDPPTTSAVNLASEMSYQMFLNQLCRRQQEKQQEDDIVVLSNSPQKRSLAASTSERAPTEWKRRRSGSPQSRGSPARIDGPPIASTLAQSFLLPSFGALSAFQQQMMMSHPESGMLGQSPQAMAAFLSHLKNTNFGKSFDDSIRHEAATPQTTHPHQLMNSLIMAASGGNSSDDDWESMMEVSNTDEAEKIRMMVGDKAAPVTDPNQCLMCRRVLSCKSALQMHYRTHTGERPFKCKICQRAFTTKGNLKTHMSVHKAKHSIQATPPLIAGHGSMHPFLGLQSASPLARPMIDRGERPPAAFLAAASQNQCPFCLKRFPAAAFIQQHIMQQHAGLLMPVGPRLFFSRPPLLGTPPTTQQLGAIATAAGKPPLAALTSFLGTAPPPFDSPTAALQRDDAMTKHSRTPPSSQSTPAGWDSAAKRQTSPTLSVSPSASSQRLSQFSMSALCSEKQKRPATDGADSGEPALGQQPLDSLKALMGDGQLPQNALHQLLLSSFIKNASNLDIEPNCAGGGESAANFFSPTAFYGLTGRIENGPSSESDPSTESVEAQSDADAGAPEPKRPKTEPINEPQPSQMASFAVRADSETATGGVTSGALPSSLEAMEKMCAVAEPASSPLLMAPLSKHQCGVCRKNFSSSSALQIHIRTHTGERPFKCDICSHTFTTRGNLKVHMGTHSYQPNPPRRGRRIFDYHMSGGAGSPVEPDMSPSLLGRQGVAGFGPTTGTPQTPQTAPLAFPAFLAAAVAASAAVVATGGTTTPLDALLNSGSVLPPSLLAAVFSAASATPQPQLPAEDAAPASPLAACPICRASFATAAEMQSHFESHIAAFAEATADKFDDGDEAASASADAGRLNGGSDGSQPLIGAKLFV